MALIFRIFDIGRCMKVYESICKYMYMEVYGGIRMYMKVYGGIWRYMDLHGEIYGGIWGYMEVYGSM